VRPTTVTGFINTICSRQTEKRTEGSEGCADLNKEMMFTGVIGRRTAVKTWIREASFRDKYKKNN
jgi:hypothetical protein